MSMNEPQNLPIPAQKSQIAQYQVPQFDPGQFRKQQISNFLLGFGSAPINQDRAGLTGLSKAVAGGAQNAKAYQDRVVNNLSTINGLNGMGYNINPNTALYGDANNMLKMYELKSKTDFNKARANYYNKSTGSSMFGGSKNAFLTAVNFMNSPDFENLPPEQQQVMKDWVLNQAKNPGALYDQKYAEAHGKGMGTIPTARTIEREKETGKGEAKLGYAGQLKEQEAAGKQKEQDINEYINMASKMPELITTINKLKELAPKATYTAVGQFSDEARRQAGLPVGEGAVARTEYSAIINNQILPLLRDTFGAQFTEREGETLRQSLGDVNKSPEEKNAVLDAFIQQRINNIKSQQSKINQKYNTSIPQIQVNNANTGNDLPNAPQLTKEQAIEELKRRGKF